jgi:hypothetical protein
MCNGILGFCCNCQCSRSHCDHESNSAIECVITVSRSSSICEMCDNRPPPSLNQMQTIIMGGLYLTIRVHIYRCTLDWKLRQRKKERSSVEFKGYLRLLLGVQWNPRYSESWPLKRERKQTRPSFCFPHLRLGMYVPQSLRNDASSATGPMSRERPSRSLANSLSALIRRTIGRG